VDSTPQTSLVNSQVDATPDEHIRRHTLDPILPERSMSLMLVDVDVESSSRSTATELRIEDERHNSRARSRSRSRHRLPSASTDQSTSIDCGSKSTELDMVWSVFGSIPSQQISQTPSPLPIVTQTTCDKSRKSKLVIRTLLHIINDKNLDLTMYWS
jgi:hypothetical protein